MSMTDAGAGDGLFMFNSDFHSDCIVGNVGSLRLLFDFTDLINFTPDADSNLKTHRVYFPHIVGTFDQTPKRSSGKRSTSGLRPIHYHHGASVETGGKCRAEQGGVRKWDAPTAIRNTRQCHLLVKCIRLAAHLR
jgi:hypothetical protein